LTKEAWQSRPFLQAGISDHQMSHRRATLSALGT
jgi:hypothetical protein